MPNRRRAAHTERRGVMEPAIGMAALWAIFIATHIGLTARAVRAPVIARIGDWGFNLAFSALAIVLFAVAVHYYAAHSIGGLAGLGLADVPLVRAVLIPVIVFGVVLASAS